MDRLLGNERLKQGLSAALEADKLSHCYLIAGPSGSGKHTLAGLLAAAMECTAERGRPCGRCAQCRKVFAGTHPDVVTVDETARKTVGVDLIRRARQDVYVLPNEGRRKVYVFPRAMDMNPNAQNALLKVIEEPPSYASFLLLSDSAERLLPTIRSRAVCLQLSPLPEELCLRALQERHPERDDAALREACRRSEGFLGRAELLLEAGQGLAPETLRFADCYARRDKLGLTELLVPMERLKREQLAPILLQWQELISQALSVRAGMPGRTEAAEQLGRGRTARELTEALTRLERASELLVGNAAPGAVCGALQVWLA